LFLLTSGQRSFSRARVSAYLFSSAFARARFVVVVASPLRGAGVRGGPGGIFS